MNDNDSLFKQILNHVFLCHYSLGSECMKPIDFSDFTQINCNKEIPIFYLRSELPILEELACP